ncbi:MAG TPA: TlpA family protein disulfide reductase [Chloroflexi bacterium]|nr:TlpA family protein disulfide reductase [Chloroflexota bacterium]
MTESTPPVTSQNTNIHVTVKTSKNTKTILLVVGLVILLALFGVFAWGLQTRESTQLGGAPAPLFTLTTFEGDEIVLEDLRGEVVVINFWASWCVECYKEAALLERASHDYANKGVRFIGVAYLDTEKDAMAYMQKYGVTYPSGYDMGSEISKDYRITGVPETFFVDKAGNIAHVQIGPIEKPQLYQLLDKLVTGGGS